MVSSPVPESKANFTGVGGDCDCMVYVNVPLAASDADTVYIELPLVLSSSMFTLGEPVGAVNAGMAAENQCISYF